jgi:hypothetical protein
MARAFRWMAHTLQVLADTLHAMARMIQEVVNDIQD